VRVATVGKALANTEVQIIDPATKERLPVGEQGELCTRGYLVMKGYDADPAATAEAVDSEGWLHTGDLAVLRPDGYFSFKGRAKDTIIRGGENIYPREVEDFLHTHPKIADVYVIGIPDAKLGETVLAWVQLKPGEHGQRGRDSRFLPRQDRLLQGPAVHPLRGFVPADGDQEGAEVPDARAGDPRARTGRCGSRRNMPPHACDEQNAQQQLEPWKRARYQFHRPCRQDLVRVDRHGEHGPGFAQLDPGGIQEDDAQCDPQNQCQDTGRRFAT
jgi:hypothetical protein